MVDQPYTIVANSTGATHTHTHTHTHTDSHTHTPPAFIFPYKHEKSLYPVGVHERKLGTCGTEADHCPGTVLAASVKLLSNTVRPDKRTPPFPSQFLILKW